MRQGRYQQQEQQVIQVQTFLRPSRHPVYEIPHHRLKKALQQHLFRQHLGPKRQKRQEPQSQVPLYPGSVVHCLRV